MPEQTMQEWVASLSADDCERMVLAEMEKHNPRGVHAALGLLAVKDAERAETCRQTILLGLDIARRRGEAAETSPSASRVTEAPSNVVVGPEVDA